MIYETKSIWGEGLVSKFYCNHHISLRRNKYVYEVALSCRKFRFTFVVRRGY
jgi:hypothetical protein